PGEVRYRWKDYCSFDDLMSAADILAQLHFALSNYDKKNLNNPIKETEIRLIKIDSAIDYLVGSSLREYITKHWKKYLDNCRKLIAQVKSIDWDQTKLQWSQGDFQLENLLFQGNQITGIVDFDNVRSAYREMDLAFALFSLTRTGAREE